MPEKPFIRATYPTNEQKLFRIVTRSGRVQTRPVPELIDWIGLLASGIEGFASARKG